MSKTELLYFQVETCYLVAATSVDTWTEQKRHIQNPTINRGTWESPIRKLTMCTYTVKVRKVGICLSGKEVVVQTKGSWEVIFERKKCVWKESSKYPDWKKGTGSVRWSWRSKTWVELNAGRCPGGSCKQLCCTNCHYFLPNLSGKETALCGRGKQRSSEHTAL